jgi:hypothetical protein
MAKRSTIPPDREPRKEDPRGAYNNKRELTVY